MSNAMAVQSKNNEIGFSDDLWNNEVTLADIKKVYQKDASDSEFKVFCEQGRATGLNPFLREIWMIKYDKSSPAQIFIGRDGYRKSARRDPQYRGHHVDTVYSTDDFHYDYNTGKLKHEKKMTDRGKLLGAFCLTHSLVNDRPYYVWVDLSEYNTGKSNWAKMPATMIKKVAEAQCLRMACPEIFGGSLSDEERYSLEEQRAAENTNRASNKLSALIQGKAETVQVQEHVDSNGEIHDLMQEMKDIIDQAESESDLKKVTPMVANLQSANDRNTIRALYKVKLEELKRADTHEAEFEVVEPEKPSEYEKVKSQILKAMSKETLDIAADLIRECSEDKQAELKELYAQRTSEFGSKSN